MFTSILAGDEGFEPSLIALEAIRLSLYLSPLLSQRGD
jgi:hypothetical protein